MALPEAAAAGSKLEHCVVPGQEAGSDVDSDVEGSVDEHVVAAGDIAAAALLVKEHVHLHAEEEEEDVFYETTDMMLPCPPMYPLVLLPHHPILAAPPLLSLHATVLHS